MARKKTSEGDLNYIPFRNPCKAGRPLAYTPEQLAKKFEKFVEWAQSHPIKVRKFSDHSGENFSSDSYTEERPRLISVASFLNYIGMSQRWWGELSTGTYGEAFSVVKEAITQYCFEYQYECASTWQYNGNIVSRYLGLAEKREAKVSGDGTVVMVNSKEEKDAIDNMGELGV